MPLNKLENFLKNTEGRIIYVNPSDLDATDSISNLGNSLTKPFKTVQRALLESARFSYLRGNNNDITEKTTILLFPGEYIIDNRPGFAIKDVSGTATAVSPTGELSAAIESLSLTLDSNFDITQDDNILYKFNSINGGVVVPRGTSIIGLDLRKTKIRAKYIPNPTDDTVKKTAIFRITGACYFWQLSFFDADDDDLVFTDPVDFSTNNKSSPTFSHHKLTCFEYADGVNVPQGYDITDLDMYYSKLSNAYNIATAREIFATDKYPQNPLGFAKQRPEWEIVGAFAEDPIVISTIISGNGFVPTSQITVTTATEHGLTSGTPIKIRGVSVEDYNISTKVQNIISPTQFTYLLESVRDNLPATPAFSSIQTVTVETDTVSGASPYIFNCSLRSVWGMNGMHADGSKASGFRSMVVAQFTGVSLQKDDRAFVKYNKTSRKYDGIFITKQTGSDLSANSSSLNSSQVYHLDSSAIYRTGWEPSHIKISNDSFIQIVSVFAIGFNKHFDVESGGDASITNSNSNFGQISLSSDGFRSSSFDKDNNAYVTSIITPKSIDTSKEINIDWISFDVGLTTSVGITSHLYLFGFTASDDIPPTIIQGYRIGSKSNELVYVDFDGTTKSASICMVDSFSGNASLGLNISEKSYRVTSGPASNVFSLSTIHGLQNGEKVRIISDDGDLPENIESNTVYYAITTGLTNTQVKLASSKTNADAGVAINVYGGSNLSIYSRCSDKISGDIGFPIQYDSLNSNWYIHSTANNQIYSQFASQGVSGIGERSPVAFVRRVEDSRSLDDKLYKIRVVIPQNVINSRSPIGGYIIQESNSTGIGSDGYANTQTITAQDLDFSKNPRILSKCAVVGSAISATSELPHNLNAGDIIKVSNVVSSTNTTGKDNDGYNGTFIVSSVVSDKVFLYSDSLKDILGVSRNPGTFTNTTSTRTINLPRFERNDLQGNFYIYRSDIISEYVEGVQDGIYHLYVLNANNPIQEEFTNIKYSQNVVDLYPQLDKDNIDENPRSSRTFSKRSPLGEVVTNDLKKSLTRESIDSFVSDVGIGYKIVATTSTIVSGNVGIATLTFDREHNLSGITTFTNLVGGTGHNIGTYFNVKLFNENTLSTWNGATAKVIVNSSGTVSSAEIISRGSAYTPRTLYFDISVIGGSADATISVVNSGISSAIGDSVQITGIGTTSDIHTRITAIPSTKQVSFAITTGDPNPRVGQYMLSIGPSVEIGSSTYSSTTGITTFTTPTIPHGLYLGNRFTVLSATGENLGEFLVGEKVSNTSFNSVTNKQLSTARYIIKQGFTATNAISDRTQENISVRGLSNYDNEYLILSSSITTETDFEVSLPYSGIGTMSRFPLGSYIQIDDEIMRVSRNSLTGVSVNRLNVIRGVLGTQTQSHSSGSIIKKIKPVAIELRRPSISRASGHTFEYLGYGPGNYSTGLPQIQVKTLTEREDFLSQSQERSGGAVVYTGMNSDGDFFIGNTKYSSTSGTQKTFDIPTPTVTGQDPTRSSVIFDEVRIKERLLVEGGNSSTVLSQFDGPVTFNKQVIFTDDITVKTKLKISDTTQSTTTTNGALIVSGGTGIAKNLNVGGSLNVTGISTFQSNVYLGDGDNLYFGAGSDLQIYHDGSNSYIDVTSGATGDLYVRNTRTGGDVFIQADNDSGVLRTVFAATGTDSAAQLFYDGTKRFETTSTGVVVTGSLNSTTSTSTTFTATTGFLPDADEGAYLGTAALPFSDAHIGEIAIANTNDNTINTASGNLILSSLGGTVEINNNLTVSGATTLNSTLGVSGNTTLTGTLTVNGGSGGTAVQVNNGGDLVLLNAANTGSAALFCDTNNELKTNGNVLIGGLLTSNTLTVNSTATFNGASTFNSTLTGTLSGNASTATNLSTTRANWSTNGTITAVVGQLSWKNYGNGHTIFDASASTSPAGGAVNNTNSQVAWSATYPTLMGWNGTNTYGVRVDSARRADSAASADTATSVSGYTGTLWTSANDGPGSSLNADLLDNIDSSSFARVDSSSTFTVQTYFRSNLGATSGALSGPPLQAYSTGNNSAFMSFHKAGVYAVNMGLDSDNVLRIGGWSAPANRWQLDMSGNMYAAGDIIAFASDERLKENIQPLENALDKVLALSGFTYNFNEIGKSLGFDTETTYVGVSAQEVQAVLPEAVKPAPADSNYITVQYEKLVPLLIEAIKELKAEINELKGVK